MVTMCVLQASAGRPSTDGLRVHVWSTVVCMARRLDASRALAEFLAAELRVLGWLRLRQLTCSRRTLRVRPFCPLLPERWRPREAVERRTSSRSSERWRRREAVVG
jgi:hypothetical protein